MPQSLLTADRIKNHVRKHAEPPEATPHDQILNKLKEKIEEVDFLTEVNKDNEGNKIDSLNKKHYVVITIDKILELAKKNDWGLCKKHDFIYLYNGAYWSQLEEGELETFLGDAAKKMGVSKFDAHYHRFRDELLKQFMSIAHLPTPQQPDELVLINLKNGTVEINPESENYVTLRKPKRTDFLTYQLPFHYNKEARASRFKQYLDEVLPNKKMQKILAEYLGYVFVRPSRLKLEKALILHGSGANGKSVFFEIVNALLGNENVSTYTLTSLTDKQGYYRANLANKLVNYASEINGNMETSLFKQLVSGEPVEARLPYGKPFTLKNYAKLIFNCNELPSDVEHTNAFFRRFMIVPFDVTIPEHKQDKQLAKKIIQNELSGVFNWVLEGLQRVLQQKGFTQCEVVNYQSEKYRKESDSVQMFISERGYKDDLIKTTLLKELYGKYKRFCEVDGYRPTAKRTFSKRLENAGYEKKKESAGMAFFLIESRE